MEGMREEEKSKMSQVYWLECWVDDGIDIQRLRNDRFVLRWNREVYFTHYNLAIYIDIQEEKSALEVSISVVSH